MVNSRGRMYFPAIKCRFILLMDGARRVLVYERNFFQLTNAAHYGRGSRDVKYAVLKCAQCVRSVLNKYA